MALPRLSHAWLVLGLCYIFTQGSDAQLPSAAQDRSAYVNELGPLYRSNATLNAQLNALANSKPVYAKWAFLQNTTSRRIRYAELQNGNIVNSARRTGVLMCAQHAREVFAVEVCYWLTRFMATDVDSLLTFPEVQRKLLATGKFGSGTVDKTRLVAWIEDILNKMRLIVIPLMNAEGYRLVEGGSFAQRKTPTGVDLNRNWPFGFSTSSSIPEASRSGETYRGPRALSEYQSYTVHQAAKNLWKPSLFVDIHTGMESIMMPWGHKVTLTDIPNNVIYAWEAWIAAMNRRAITGALVAASPGSSQLYLTPGSVENTFYATFGAKYSMTIETFSAVAEGIGWTCPAMRSFKSACTNSGCGCTNCRKQDGTVVGCARCNCPGRRSSINTGRKILGDDIQLGYSESDVATPAAVGEEAGGSETVAAVVDDSSADVGTEGDAGESPVNRIMVDPEEEALKAFAAAEAAKAAAGLTEDDVEVAASTAYQSNAADPFIRRYYANQCGSSCSTFKFFNPITPAQYRESIARWLVTMMLSIEYVANNP